MSKHLLFGLVLLLVFPACRKTEVLYDINLLITSPFENAVFDISDTVMIRAYATSDKPIESIDVSIIDKNFVPAGPTVTTTINSNKAEVVIPYTLEGISTGDGEYYIKVHARGEYNSKTAWIKIFVSDIPLEFKGILIESYTSQQTRFYHLPPNVQSPQLIFSRPADVAYSHVHMRPARYYISGSYFEPFEAIDPEDLSGLWTLPAIHNPPEPWFTGIVALAGEVAVLTYDGNVRLYSPSGQMRMQFSCGPMFIPRKIVRSANWYFVAGQQKNGLAWELQVRYLTGGGLMQTCPLPIDVVDISIAPSGHPILGSNICIAGNSGGAGKLRVYLVSSNYTYEPVNTALAKLNASATAGEMLLLATQQGILLYDHKAASISTLHPIQAGFIAYDASQQRIFASSGKSIHSISFPAGALLGTEMLPDSIQRLHILYNR